MKCPAPEWLLLCLLAGALSSGCATTPPALKEEPSEERPVVLQEAEHLLEIASPDSLKRAIELLKRPEIKQAPEALELSSLASELYIFLYPELAAEPDLRGPPTYTGPYLGLLTAAKEGKAGGLHGGEAQEADFFELVLPSFYLLKQKAGLKLQDPERLKYILGLAAKKNRGSVLPPFFQGLIAEGQGDLNRAAALYSESSSREVSFYPGLHRLALVKFKLGDPERAASLLEKVLPAIPGNSLVARQLSEAYLAVKKVDKAEEMVARRLFTNPDDPQALLLRARILKESGNWSQALKPLNLMLLEHPDAAEAYLLKAQILYEHAKDSEAAVDLLREAAKDFSADYRFPELMGRVLLETGSRAEGLAELNQALKLNPDSTTALRLLLRDAERMKLWQQSVTYLARILEQEETEQDLLAAYRVYSNLGDTAQELDYAEKLYNSGNQLTYASIYARALYLNNKMEQARSVMERALADISAPLARSELYLLKALDVGAEDPEVKMKYLRASLREYPDNLEALIEILKVFISYQDYRKARLYLKRAVEIDPANRALKQQLKEVETALQP